MPTLQNKQTNKQLVKEKNSKAGPEQVIFKIVYCDLLSSYNMIRLFDFV